jgi:hypothetical protein
VRVVYGRVRSSPTLSLSHLRLLFLFSLLIISVIVGGRLTRAPSDILVT